jgi:hypothetical protein
MRSGQGKFSSLGFDQNRWLRSLSPRRLCAQCCLAEAALREPAHRQTRVGRWAVPGGWRIQGGSGIAPQTDSSISRLESRSYQMRSQCLTFSTSRGTQIDDVAHAIELSNLAELDRSTPRSPTRRARSVSCSRARARSTQSLAEAPEESYNKLFGGGL